MEMILQFCAGLLAATTVTQAWEADPVAWRRQDGGAIVAQATAFAFPDASEKGRRVTVSARVTPQSCESKDWSTIGIAIHDSKANFWHLALVKSPEAMGWRRYELAEMLDSNWVSQSGLKREVSRFSRDWKYNEAYDMSMTLGPDGISGRIYVAQTGEEVYRCAYSFGDKKAVRCGRPAAHSTGLLSGRVEDFRYEVSDTVADEIKTVAPYVAVGADTGVRATPKGFFYFAKVDGRDWAIDPLGRGVTLIGVDHVQPWGMFCESLNYSPYGRHVKEAYPSYEAWSDETIDRLKAWGFTMLGAGCDVARLAHRGLVHTVFLNMGNRLAYVIDKDWAIAEGRHAPCTAFPNVFHPDFEAACDWVARQSCVPNRDDPWIVGYFIDNELCWWGRGSRAEGMFDLVMEKPDTHSAKKALVKFIAGRPVTKELKTEFLRLVAERYFKVTSEAIRRHDPNHMVLGCRFAGFGGAHEVVWREAAKYCDLITFNCYPWADLNRNIVLTARGGEPVADRFGRFHEMVGKPMLVTEWSFPALDTGRPCLHGAGQRFQTQAQRVRATEMFAKTMLALPFFVGYDYFMWVDQPAPGMNHNFPEDSNYGLVQEDGRPHEGITGMFAELHRNVGRWREAGLPKEREVPPSSASERNSFMAHARGDASKVVFVREGDSWSLSNDAGLRIAGRVGSSKMADEVSRDGVVYGRYGAMLMTVDPRWIGTSKLTDVSFERSGTCGFVTLTAEGSSGELRFRAVHRLALAPGCRGILAEIVSVANIGSVPFAMPKLFMCPTAAAAERPLEQKTPPNMWGRCESYWRLDDGRSYGAFSRDASADSFHLWVDGGGAQHPDIIFSPGVKPVELAPGETYSADRAMSAVLVMRKQGEGDQK